MPTMGLLAVAGGGDQPAVPGLRHRVAGDPPPGRLDEHRPQPGVARLQEPTLATPWAALQDLRRQPDHPGHRAAVAETSRVVQLDVEGHRRDRPHAGDRPQRRDGRPVVLGLGQLLLASTGAGLLLLCVLPLVEHHVQAEPHSGPSSRRRSASTAAAV